MDGRNMEYMGKWIEEEINMDKKRAVIFLLIWMFGNHTADWGGLNNSGILEIENIALENSTSYSNQAVCYLTNGEFGYCTDAVNVTGGCSCSPISNQVR